ncbi:MAG: hypothetical protein NTZ73_04430 [Candidatus Diapherotrites archaeon]|nr:hypothetical protein [Candidatus Diapherotrites archaeon]
MCPVVKPRGFPGGKPHHGGSPVSRILVRAIRTKDPAKTLLRRKIDAGFFRRKGVSKGYVESYLLGHGLTPEKAKEILREIGF